MTILVMLLRASDKDENRIAVIVFLFRSFAIVAIWHVAAKAHVDRPEWIRPDRYTEIFIMCGFRLMPVAVIIQMIPLMLASHMLASLERYNSSLWRFGIYFVVMLCAKTFPHCKTMRCITQLQSS